MSGARPARVLREDMTQAPRVPRHPSPVFLVTCMDGPDTKALRERHLFGHLDHIEANNADYLVAGPIRMDADGPIVGSVFLVPAETADAALSKMQGDPYIASGMYASITVQHFAPACGQWMGGVIWDQDEIRADAAKYS